MTLPRRPFVGKLIMELSEKQFRAAVIAQQDNNDSYDARGYVAGVHAGTAFITAYGHCSCYNTFEAICSGAGYRAPATDGSEDVWPEDFLYRAAFDWTGTPDSLVAMAKRMADVHVPERVVDPADQDYGYLLRVYARVLEWDAAGRPLPAERA